MGEQMTPEETIRAIESNWPPEQYTMLREALTLAIAALRKPQSAEGATVPPQAEQRQMTVEEIQQRLHSAGWLRMRIDDRPIGVFTKRPTPDGPYAKVAQDENGAWWGDGYLPWLCEAATLLQPSPPQPQAHLRDWLESAWTAGYSHATHRPRGGVTGASAPQMAAADAMEDVVSDILRRIEATPPQPQGDITAVKGGLITVGRCAQCHASGPGPVRMEFDGKPLQLCGWHAQRLLEALSAALGVPPQQGVMVPVRVRQSDNGTWWAEVATSRRKVFCESGDTPTEAVQKVQEAFNRWAEIYR